MNQEKRPFSFQTSLVSIIESCNVVKILETIKLSPGKFFQMQDEYGTPLIFLILEHLPPNKANIVIDCLLHYSTMIQDVNGTSFLGYYLTQIISPVGPARIVCYCIVLYFIITHL